MRTFNDTASLGIVLSDGGTRSSWAVGVLYGLYKEHGIDFSKVRALAAISGGEAAGIFATTGHFKEMLDWAEKFDDPRFISWGRWRKGPIMDINFLVDGIFKKQAPLLELEERKANVNYFLAATRFPEDVRHWFTRDSGESLWEELRAGKTMSGVSDWWVDIDGIRYADGCFSTTLEDCIDKVVEEGAQRVIVIDNASYGHSSALVRSFLRWRVRKAPEYIRSAVEDFCNKDEQPVKSRPGIVVCRSKRLATRHALVRAARYNNKSIEQGYAAAARLQLPTETISHQINPSGDLLKHPYIA
ncbi:MAG: hypothetical protein Q7S50_01615 [bacterium]|nr:hypothetical protein [bacterium]